MKMLSLAVSTALLSACHQTSVGSELGSSLEKHCALTYSGLEDCRTTIDRQAVSIEAVLGEPDSGERALIALSVTVNDEVQDLPVANGITLFEGDRGYVLLQDIDFDGHYDIGVTTSFGVANLYLDYWVYDASEQNFRYVGNFPQLTPKPDEQVLTSTTRVDAASYEHLTWVWKDGDLKVRL